MANPLPAPTLADLLHWAQAYRATGAIPIAVDAGKKKPTRSGWQKEDGSDTGLHATLIDGGNLGLLLGEPSGGLIDIDLDCVCGIQFAPHFLPDTPWKSGHTDRPGSHWWYRTAAGTCPKSKQRHAPGKDGAMWVELRSTGLQTLVPPSTYPGGQSRYEWVGGWQPAGPSIVDGGLLSQCVAWLYAACVLAPFWNEGARHSLSLPLAGTLLRGGMKQPEVEGFFTSLCRATGDPEDRLADIRSTAEKIAKDEAVRAFTTLASLIGADSASAVTKELGLSSVPDELASDVRRIIDVATYGAKWREVSTHAENPLLGFLVPGEAHLLTGGTNVGKTFLAMHLVGCAAAGVVPWSDGMPDQRDPEHFKDKLVVYLGPDASSQELKVKLEHLEQDKRCPWLGHEGAWQDRLVSLANDPWTDHELLDQLAMDEKGWKAVLNKLQEAKADFGKEIGLVILDAFSDFIRSNGGNNPENDNAYIAQVCRRMGYIAKALGAAVLVLDHPSKKDQEAELNATMPARGASAKGTKFRISLALSGKGSVRRLHVVSNFFKGREVFLKVSDSGDGIDYFEWCEPEKATDSTKPSIRVDLGVLLKGTAIGTVIGRSDLIRMMLGLPPKKKVSSSHEKEVNDLLGQWLTNGYLRPTHSSGEKPKLVGYELLNLPSVDEDLQQ